MSDDLYDSLEDDYHDGRSSCDSFYLHQQESVPAKRVSKLESIPRHSSFCFGKVVDKEGLDFSPSYRRVPVHAHHRHNFLPDINKGKSLQGNLNKFLQESIDYAELAEKGLLLNEDGSFTKSPRPEPEELPFITREYKNLVLQKQKTYEFRKKDSQVKKQKSKCSHKEASKTSVNKSYRRNNSCYYPDYPVKANDYLSDPMRHVQYQDKNQKNKCRCGIPRQRPKCCHSEIAPPFIKLSEGNNLMPRSYKPLNRQMSQITLTTQKPRMNYAERQQYQNGYSPMYLRHGIKKITSETTRSNLGDSMPGKLSDVSSRAMSAGSVDESDDEEKFYEQIMKLDKNKLERNIFGSTHRSSHKSGSLRELEKLRGTGKSYPKPSPKPLYIDLRKNSDKSPPHNCKKHTHNCPTHPAAQLSKTELVLKGKAYGHMVNARNILKFNSQDKLSGRGNHRSKIEEGNRMAYKQDSAFELRGNNGRKVSPRFGSTLKRKNEKERHERVSKERSVGDGSNSGDDEHHGFCLPRVTISEIKNVNAANLLRKHSCLYGPFC